MVLTAPESVGERTAFEVQVEASERLDGLRMALFDITNGHANRLVQDGASYTLWVRPTGVGDITVALGTEVVTDLEGNPNTSVAPATVRWTGTDRVDDEASSSCSTSGSPTGGVLVFGLLALAFRRR